MGCYPVVVPQMGNEAPLKLQDFFSKNGRFTPCRLVMGVDKIFPTKMEVTPMKRILISLSILALLAAWAGAAEAPLGLPKVPVPKDNPLSLEKIQLGDKLFHDERFSTTGKVSCSTCHTREKAFTDNLPVSEGINQLQGTRNAPTVLNAAYFRSQFWDGREPSLEEQSGGPPLNPVEMGLKNYDPILQVIRADPEYVRLFGKAFGIKAAQITMKEVKKAIGKVISKLTLMDQKRR